MEVGRRSPNSNETSHGRPGMSSPGERSGSSASRPIARSNATHQVTQAIEEVVDVSHIGSRDTDDLLLEHSCFVRLRWSVPNVPGPQGFALLAVSHGWNLPREDLAPERVQPPFDRARRDEAFFSGVEMSGPQF